MKRLVLLAIAVFSTNLTLAQINNSAQVVIEDFEKCDLKLKQDPKLKPLIGKLPFDYSKSQTLEILANQSKPNTKEKAALSYFATEIELCQDSGITSEGHPPEITALYQAYRAEITSALADLYAGKLTFGGFAKVRAKQAIEFRNNAFATLSGIEKNNAELERLRREVEAQERQREAQAKQKREDEFRRAAELTQRARQDEEDKRRSLAMDKAACRNEASRNAAPPPRDTSTNSTTNCTSFGGGAFGCNTQTAPSGGRAAAFAMGAQWADDSRYYSNCMAARGWSKTDAR